MDKKVNLFVIGAPKCGTTSITNWISQHPNILLSSLKEPYYFDTDHPVSRIKRNKASYERLFKNADENHRYLAEGSTRYLYSKVAVQNILAYNPEAKFVVCLRNPVDMAYSLHQQEVFSCHENLKSFYEAWAVQKERNKGRKFPEDCKDKVFLEYNKVCALGTQCELLLQKVDRDKVHFILLDELKEDPEKAYKALLSFLGLAYQEKIEFTSKNTSKEYRFRGVQKIIQFLAKIKAKYDINFGMGLHKLNKKKVKRTPLTSEMRAQLEDYFKPEIHKLETILNCNLSPWIKTRP